GLQSAHVLEGKSPLIQIVHAISTRIETGHAHGSAFTGTIRISGGTARCKGGALWTPLRQVTRRMHHDPGRPAHPIPWADCSSRRTARGASTAPILCRAHSYGSPPIASGDRAYRKNAAEA